jgi:amino acid transporter
MANQSAEDLPSAAPRPARAETHATEEVLVAETQLAAGAMGLPAIFMQSVATIAPALGIVLGLQAVVGFTGVSAPLAFLIITVVLLAIAIPLAELARKLPSAGAFYTYASRALHPRAGFMAGWLFSLAYPLGPGFIIAFFGYSLNILLESRFSVHVPWWITFLVVASLVSFLVYRGIAVSAKTLVIFGSIEVAIIVALSFWALIHPGAGGFNFKSFNPADVPSVHGLYLAVVFSLFIVIGFEEAAPLAEETENPDRNIPIAMIGSVIVIGLFFVFCSWGLIVGYGTDRVTSLVNSAEAPAFVVARSDWGAVGTVVVLLALLNSTIAASMASYNAATRLMFGMGRSGAFPRWLGEVHPRLKTPVNAIYLEIVLTFAGGLFFGFLLGPANYFATFGLFNGIAVGLFLTIVMVGVIVFFYREQRANFKIGRHLVLPILGSAAMLWLIYKTVNPLPPSPEKWGVPAAGAWILVGLAILFVRSRGKREDWQLTAGVAAHERPETTDELAHRPIV